MYRARNSKLPLSTMDLSGTSALAEGWDKLLDHPSNLIFRAEARMSSSNVLYPREGGDNDQARDSDESDFSAPRAEAESSSDGAHRD